MEHWPPDDVRHSHADTALVTAVVDSLDVGIVISDVDGTWLHWNPAACRMHGFDTSGTEPVSLEAAARLFALCELSGAPVPVAEWPLQRVVRGEQVNDVELVATRSDVPWERRLSYSGRLVKRGDGAAVIALLLVRDMSDTLRAETAAAHWQRVFAEVEFGLAIGDPDSGRFLDVNPAFARQRGYAVEELIGTPIADIYAPESRVDMFRGLDAADTRGHAAFESVHLRKDGTRLPVLLEVTVIRDRHGVAVSRVAIAVDISEQKRVEAALRASEERHRHLVETSFDWVWETDRSGRYTYSNMRVRDILGYEAHEILGRTPFDLVPAAAPPDTATQLRLLLDGHRPFFAHHTLRAHKNGMSVDVESNGVPFYGSDGSFAGFRGMDRDVTSRRRLEDQLRQSQKLEAIGQLAGGVAHDFNNILAGTMMHLGLLQQNPTVDDQTRRALRELERETQRAVGLTRQLLMFSRRSVLDIRRLDIGETVSHLLKMLRRVIGEHIDLHLESSAAPPAQADAGMIEQVVMNLSVNARDAMPKGGRITIGVAPIRFEEAAVEDHVGRRPGLFIRLSVTDTGTGMDAATQARMFDPFFTTKEAGHGTGLGLATVHGIVAQHDGWIEVNSRLHHGTRFDIYLPADESAPADPETEGDVTPPVRGTETILLVEDDARVRRIIAMALGECGYRVIQAASGADALARWSEVGPRIDLLFTDVVMPGGVSGLDLVTALRASKPGLRAIISSGYSSDLAQSGVPTGAGLAYLPKPYDMPTLARAVRACLDGPA